MVIIATFIGHITQNFILGKTNFNLSRFGCPNCGYEGRLHRHGTYSRNVITFFQIFRINVQRFKCPKCKKTCSMLPCYLIPYFQYSFEFIISSLYMIYVLSIKPYHIPELDIPELVTEVCPHCHISLQSIRFYMKRFMLYKFMINSFFAAYDHFHYDTDVLSFQDSVAACTLLKKIFLYNTSVGSFNSGFQRAFHRYFMSP